MTNYQDTAIEELRNAYATAFHDIGTFLIMVLVGLIVLIGLLCYSSILGGQKIQPSKPFDPDYERRETDRIKL